VAPPPDLLPAAVMALHCWAFCGGWAPERWPHYEAFHPVEDWSVMAELLEHIRQTINASP
jgi:hypothetical protein